MSLRKPPTGTPAMLAANRANAHKPPGRVRWKISIASRQVFKLKPECVRKHRGNENVIGRSRIWEAPQGRCRTGATTSKLAFPRLKPSGTTVAQLPGLDQNDPLCRHLLKAKDDLLSWLHHSSWSRSPRMNQLVSFLADRARTRHPQPSEETGNFDSGDRGGACLESAVE
jgi:hypothetical protein